MIAVCLHKSRARLAYGCAVWMMCGPRPRGRWHRMHGFQHVAHTHTQAHAVQHSFVVSRAAPGAMAEDMNLLDNMSDISASTARSGCNTTPVLSLAQVMAHVALVESRRKELPAPEATADFPLPGDGACKFCKRPWKTTPNPLAAKGDASTHSPFLSPARVGSLECVSCRSAQTWAFKTFTKANLLKTLSDPEQFSRYMVIVYCWEERYNNPQAPIVKLSGQLPPELELTMEKTDTTGLETRMQLGVFWPLQVYKRHEGKEPPKKDVRNIQHNGVEHKGVVREEKHGRPIGTIEMSQFCTQAVSKKRLLESASTAVHGEVAVNELFKRARQDAGLKITMEKDGEGVTVAPKFASPRGGEGRDENIFDDIWSPWGASASKAPNTAQPRGSKPQENEGTTPTKRTLEATASGASSSRSSSDKLQAKRAIEFDMSEQALRNMHSSHMSHMSHPHPPPPPPSPPTPPPPHTHTHAHTHHPHPASTATATAASTSTSTSTSTHSHAQTEN